MVKFLQINSGVKYSKFGNQEFMEYKGGIADDEKYAMVFVLSLIGLNVNFLWFPPPIPSDCKSSSVKI